MFIEKTRKCFEGPTLPHVIAETVIYAGSSKIRKPWDRITYMILTVCIYSMYVACDVTLISVIMLWKSHMVRIIVATGRHHVKSHPDFNEPTSTSRSGKARSLDQSDRDTRQK